MCCIPEAGQTFEIYWNIQQGQLRSIYQDLKATLTHHYPPEFYHDKEQRPNAELHGAMSQDTPIVYGKILGCD